MGFLTETTTMSYTMYGIIKSHYRNYVMPTYPTLEECALMHRILPYLSPKIICVCCMINAG